MKNNFEPTYLCIKRHSVTGLNYLCKTAQPYEKMLKYNGSGRPYWANHLKEHGKEFVETLWFCLFENKEELEKFALLCSEQWDIVRSDAWANLKPENGLDGGGFGPPKGVKHPDLAARNKMPEYRERNAAAQRGNTRARVNKGKRKTAKHKENIAKAMFGKNTSPQKREHIEKRFKRKRCPHCNCAFAPVNYSRWHGDKCKRKTND